MAATQLTKTGLNKQDFKDASWHTSLNSGFDALEARVGKTYAGDPNGNVSGEWQGQTCWDSTNSELYVCTTTGNAASAVWRKIAYTYQRTRRFTSGATFSPTDGRVRMLRVTLIGPGGNGAGAQATTAGRFSCGGGGGGGAGIIFQVTGITASYSATMTLPAGGSGSSARWDDGPNDITAGNGTNASNALVTSGNDFEAAQGGAGGSITINSSDSSFTEIMRAERMDGEDGIASSSESITKGGFGGLGPFGQGSLRSGAMAFGGSAFSFNGGDATNYGSGGAGGVACNGGSSSSGGSGSGSLAIVEEWG